MKKTSKKGFTIVELVIVIAVVAILAAVLIPTFVSITKKANESKDTQLVRNLNTALATDVGVEHETMTSALKVAADAGYDVAKINVSAKGNEILWDSANDVFCYRKDGEIQYIPETSLKIAKEEVKSYQYWIISSTVDSKYSTYLRDGYEGAKIENLTTGLDVGNNTGITEISYNRSSAEEGQTVVIRTNGGTLNINAPNDTVHHYDYIKTLSVDAVSPGNCYHEHGFVGELAKFTSGKFVAASTAEFHQTKTELEGVKDSTATFEDSGAAYGVHRFNSDEVCIIDGCNEISSNHVHVLDAGTTIVYPTCVAEGTSTHTCMTCHQIVTKSIPATGSHTWEEKGGTYKCTVCGKTQEDADTAVSMSVDTGAALATVINMISKAQTDGKTTTLKNVTITLSSNLATSEDMLIVQEYATDMSIDLNGHTLVLYNAPTDCNAGFIVRGKLTIVDSSSDHSGKIVASANVDNTGTGALITVSTTTYLGITGNYAHAELTVNDGITIDATASSNGCAIMMNSGAYVTINGGTVKANGYAISGSESDTKTSGQLVISGGEITSLESYAIYHPQSADEGKSPYGKFEISGGKITGKKGVISMGGGVKDHITLRISGGDFISGSDHIIFLDNSKCITKPKDQSVKVTGGNFTNAMSGCFCKVSLTTKGSVYQPAFSYLSGGMYKNISKDNFMVDTTGKTYKDAQYQTNYQYHDNGDGTWSVIKK